MTLRVACSPVFVKAMTRDLASVVVVSRVCVQFTLLSGTRIYLNRPCYEDIYVSLMRGFFVLW
jgi:hypothetical protein